MFSRAKDDDNVDIVISLGLWKYEKEKITKHSEQLQYLIDKP
jgi:hypothetical protein